MNNPVNYTIHQYVKFSIDNVTTEAVGDYTHRRINARIYRQMNTILPNYVYECERNTSE